MYYNGYVLTLWGYLASLLYRAHSDEVFSSATISKNPHLAFILLRFTECSAFVRSGTFSTAYQHIPLETVVANLSNIIEANGVPVEVKARAMALRLREKYVWTRGEVKTISQEPLDEQGKDWILSESAKAVEMMEGVSDKSSVLVYLARIQVEYGTVGIRKGTWDKLMAQLEHFIDRQDLYTTFWVLVGTAQYAIRSGDNEALKKIIPKVHEVKSLALGEWDTIFRKLFKNNERWVIYKECEQSIYPQSSVNDVVEDTVDGIFNAL